MEALNHLLGIQVNPSMAYHPQMDGQTKWVNQEVKQYLCIFVNYHQDDWADWLSLMEFSHNDKVNSSTCHSLFYLNWGCHLRKGIEPWWEVWVEAAKEFIERIEGKRKEAEAALERAACDMKTFYDCHHQEAPNFQPGDEVFLEGENLCTNQPSKKLNHHHFGPFKIVRKVGKCAYCLKLLSTWRVHLVFHILKLSLYHWHGTITLPPPPDIIKGEPQQEIEDIIDQWVQQEKLQYLVKWCGFPMEENEWKLAEQDLRHTQELLNDFKSHPCPHYSPQKRGGGNVRESIPWLSLLPLVYIVICFTLTHRYISLHSYPFSP